MPIDLDHFRLQLVNLKQDLESRREGDRERGAPVELDQSRQGRLSRMDAMQGQAMSAAVRKRREQSLRRIDAALERLAAGEFGFCLQCGEPIDVKRLEIDPATPRCAHCANG